MLFSFARKPSSKGCLIDLFVFSEISSSQNNFFTQRKVLSVDAGDFIVLLDTEKERNVVSRIILKGSDRTFEEKEANAIW